jgi:hypothetical protein
MKDDKVREDPFYLWCTESTVREIHRSHLPTRHHSPGVQLLGDVKVRGQPKKLGKLCKLGVDPSTISRPHKDSLFLLKEESGIELYDNLLIPVVPKLQNVRDAIKFTSFKNHVEGGILLALHIVKVNPLHQDNRSGLPVEHSVVPIMLEESSKTLIGTPFLGYVVASFLTERDNVPWINLIVVDHFPIGVSYRGSHLQAFKFFRREWHHEVGSP